MQNLLNEKDEKIQFIQKKNDELIDMLNKKNKEIKTLQQ